jgi:type IV secretion system protein VirB4
MKIASFFSDVLPFAGLVDDGIMVTKDGVLMTTYYIVAQDFAFCDYAIITAALKNLNNIIGLLSYSGWSLQCDAHRIIMNENAIVQYCDEDAPLTTKIFEKNRIEIAPLFQTKFYLTLCKEVTADKPSITQFFFSATGKTSRADPDALSKLSMNQDIYEFKLVAQDFYNSLASTFYSAHNLNSDELLTYLHSTFSDTQGLVKTPEHPFYLDSFLADGIFVPDTISKYNDEYILTASIHDLPSESMAEMVSKIMTLPMEFRFSTRFIFIDKDKARKNIKAARLAHFQKRKGPGAMFEESISKSESPLQDTETLALAEDSAEALREMSSGNISYGFLTTLAIVRDKDLSRVQKKLEVIKAAMVEEQFVVKTETLNNPNSFLGSIPGNIFYDPRRATVSTRNLLHFFPISASWHGTPTNTHYLELYEKKGMRINAPLAVCRTSQTGEVFYLNLDYRGVGHSLVLGPTGSGKSYLLGALCVFFLKYPNSKIIFFDVDKSSENACLNSGGKFIEINDDPDSIKFNPFSRIDTAVEQSFVTSLILDYIESKNIVKTVTMEQEIYKAIVEMAFDDPSTWSFSTFSTHIQSKEIRDAMEIFINGDYSTLFKSGPDNIQTSRWTCFEMRWLMNKAVNKENPLLVFILQYLFHVIEDSLELNGFPVKIILDEAWLFLDNPQFARRIEDWLRTLRKKNVYVILATQNLQDAFNSKIFPTLINNCFTKILLPNQKAADKVNFELYRSMGLGESDIDALVNATPKSEYFYVNPNGKQLFELCLGEEENKILLGRYDTGIYKNDNFQYLSGKAVFDYQEARRKALASNIKKAMNKGERK